MRSLKRRGQIILKIVFVLDLCLLIALCVISRQETREKAIKAIQHRRKSKRRAFRIKTALNRHRHNQQTLTMTGSNLDTSTLTDEYTSGIL